MTRVALERLSPEHQRFVKNRSRASENQKKPKAAKPTALGEVFDSKLELNFAWELERRRLARIIEEWRYHSMRFRLAPNVTYTPDFCARCGDRLTFYEVKGSWKMKNARDSRTRLQIAAYVYWWFGWQAVTQEDGQWVFEVIHSVDAETVPDAEQAGS